MKKEERTFLIVLGIVFLDGNDGDDREENDFPTHHLEINVESNDLFYREFNKATVGIGLT